MISIIIPTYQRASLVNSTLLANMFQTIFQHVECEILVSVTKGDKETEKYVEYLSQTKEIYKQLCPKVTISLLLSEEKGLIVALNNGIKASKGEYVLVLHDDIIMDKDALQRMYEDIQVSSDIMAVSGYVVKFKPGINEQEQSGKIKTIPNVNTLQIFNAHLSNNQINKGEQLMDWGSVRMLLDANTRYYMEYFTSVYLLKKEAFLDIGEYNPIFNSYTAPFADIYFTNMFVQKGYHLLFNPFVRMWHFTLSEGGRKKKGNYRQNQRMLQRDMQQDLAKYKGIMNA